MVLTQIAFCNKVLSRNLLQSRFGLSFHTEKREISVYAISIGKNGPAGIKIVKNTANGIRIGSQGLGRVTFNGATMANFAIQLQLRVLDRPVIDQTGLTDRYDFTLNWRPDEFQFPRATAAQRAAAVSTGADARSLVIDNVSKPSEN